MVERTMVPLQELVSLMRNGTTTPQNTEGNGFPVTRIETISSEIININRVRYVESEGFDVEKWRLSSGDILLSHINSVEHLGKTAIYEGEPLVLIHGMNLLLLRPDVSIAVPDYLHFALKSSQFREEVRRKCKRAINQASINQTELGAILVPLYSLDEQRRIVDILKRADSIRRLRKQALETTQQLIPALFVEMFGDPATNPKGWDEKPLGELVEIQSGGTPSKKNSNYWNGNIPWVSPKDMKSDDISDSIDHISVDALENTTLKTVPAGSVLIVVRGMILAHTVPVYSNSSNVTINQDMKALVPKAELAGKYLQWALQCQHARLLSKVTTSAHGTRKLDTNHLHDLLLPIPALELQKEFEKQVSAVRSIVMLQKMQTEKSEETMQSLMAQFF